MMEKPEIQKDQVKTLLDTPFLRVYDLQYAPGRHYFNASRREADRLAAVKTEEEFRGMLPDAVTCFVILRTPGQEPRMLLVREYRYPAGRFLIAPPAGLIDPADRDQPEPVLGAARREIQEETGISAEPTRIRVLNACAFSSPGMTDESNALAEAVYDLPDLSSLSQAGAVGAECFDGFLLVTRKEAEELLRSGRDAEGHFYSMYTWAALLWFVSGRWQEENE